MNKDRHIIAELSSFFAESVDFAKAADCKFTALQPAA